MQTNQTLGSEAGSPLKLSRNLATSTMSGPESQMLHLMQSSKLSICPPPEKIETQEEEEQKMTMEGSKAFREECPV